jgi:hypothetical protein
VATVAAALSTLALLWAAVLIFDNAVRFVVILFLQLRYFSFAPRFFPLSSRRFF